MECLKKYLSISLTAFAGAAIFAESPPQAPGLPMPDVFIDFGNLDDQPLDFIKTEISFVNHVIDRNVADVFILITQRLTASEDYEWTIGFEGRRRYAGMNDTLCYISGKSDTEDTRRRALVKKIKIGLMRYVARSAVGDDIAITMLQKTAPAVKIDRWNNWVFRIDLDGYFNGQQAVNSQSIFTQVSANRVTDIWKYNSSAYLSFYRKSFRINDTLTITDTTRSQGSWVQVVRGLDGHWSAGAGASLDNSTYSNLELGVGAWPAVEYDFFPYAQSTTRLLTVMYDIGIAFKNYYEETIYDRNEEVLFSETFSLSVNTKQRWGSILALLKFHNYFHDFSKNHLSLYSTVSLPVFKGLALDITGSGQMIHDQLSLSKTGLTPEEILLQIEQMHTSYSYYVTLGFSYTFGSMYSNIVNPRFSY